MRKKHEQSEVAAIQMRCAASLEENLKKAGSHGAKGGGRGANDPSAGTFEREYFASSAGMTFIIMRSL